MRLDGELVRDDGAAVNWRELQAGAREILVKTVGGVALIERQHFFSRARHHDRRSDAERATGPALASLARFVPDERSIAASAVHALLLELATWPKPGLVSHVDRGSHDDMDAETFRASAAAIAPYFRALADAGAHGCGMGRLRIIGLEAEAAMFAATSGVNTHRGAIFGLGLLCAAAGARAAGHVEPGLRLGDVVARLWGRRHCRWARPAAQPWQQGPASLRRRRRAHGGCQRISQHLRSRPARPSQSILIAPGDAEAARVEAASPSSRPSRTPIFCIAAAWPDFGLRDARLSSFWTKAGWARRTGASGHRQSTTASLPAVSARADRPIFSP